MDEAVKHVVSWHRAPCRLEEQFFGLKGCGIHDIDGVLNSQASLNFNIAATPSNGLIGGDEVPLGWSLC